jgi:C4-type Zn-finger protein
MNSDHLTENKVNIEQSEPLYVDINPDNPVSEIESYCVNCEENGVTRILFTKIPFFKEIIIMAFECLHCGYRNSEVQPGRSLADQAVRIEVSVTTAKVRILSYKNIHINFEKTNIFVVFINEYLYFILNLYE